MKKTLFTLIVSGLILGGLGSGCGWSGYQFATQFLSNTLNPPSTQFKVFRWCFNGLPLVDKLAQILDNKNYIVLLQNNRELRPSGGFMGSYAVLRAQSSGLREFEVQDIYVPDGQLVGHVDPPLPIQQAFGQGWWKLRDANWDPDFTVAGPQIAWFFEQGGEPTDGLIAVNLSLVNQALQVLGEIKPNDYGEIVTAKTFYNLAQKYAEENFFPGSTQKRDFLGAVGNALFKRIKQSGPIEQIKLIKLMWQELRRGEILVWFKDPQLQEVVKQKNWDGDYLYIVETNLGANKANCCVSRQVVQEISDLSTKLTISYKNDNFFENPKPPEFWGGNYIDYLRIVLPKSAQTQSVKVGDKQLVEKQLDNQYGIQDDRYQVEEQAQFKTIGFWAVVPAQSSVIAELEYKSGRVEEREYRVLVKHQPGMSPFLYKLIVNGKLIGSEIIDGERTFRWTK